MKHLMRKLVVVGSILVLLSGCATTGTTGSGSSDSSQTKKEGIAWGALIGTAIGAGIGYALQGKDGLKKGAAIGAVAGAGAGYLAGSKVAQIKEQYASEEDQLNAEIQLAAQYNEELSTSNKETLDQIDILSQEIMNIQAGSSSLVAQGGALEKKKQEIRSLTEKNNSKINEMNKELAALQEYKQSVAQAQNAGQLEQEISTLQANIAMLDQNNRQMAQLADSLSVTK